MKKSTYIALFLALTTGFSACTKDFLELEPMTQVLESNFYASEGDAFLALVSVYDALVTQTAHFVPTNADFRSDDAFVGGDPSGNDWLAYQQMELFTMDAENEAAYKLWERCYIGIYRANQLLEKVDEIEWESEASKARIVAEAKFLRAYFYWDLERHYGWAPILTEVVADVDALSAWPQSTPDQIYTQIASDLLDAIAGLPDNVTGDEIGRTSKHVANALLARIYLYHEGFAKPVLGAGAWTNGTTTIDAAYATAALESVIASGNFQLQAKYADVFAWDNENNSEMVFCYQYSEIGASGDWSYYTIDGNFSAQWYGPRNPEGDGGRLNTGWSFGIPTFSLANEFEAADPRKDVSLYDANAKLTKYTRGFQNTGYFNGKFIPLKSFEAPDGSIELNWLINYPDIRYADVLLMAAELNLTSNPTKATGYLNQVRTRALGAGAALAAVTLDDIKHERRVELSGEGHRYWDLLRWGLTGAEQAINASFQNIPTGVANVNEADFAPRNFNPATYGMYPIPAAEIRNTTSIEQKIPAYQ